MIKIQELPSVAGVNVSKLKDALIKAYNSNKNYDVMNIDGYNFVFVIGKDDEKNIPFWDFPFILDGVKNDKVVYVDLRKFVKGDIKDVVSLSDALRDKAGARYAITVAIYATLLDKGEVGRFKTVQDSLATLYGILISTVIKQSVQLNPDEASLVEVVSQAFVHNMYLDSYNDADAESVLRARLTRGKYSIPVVGKEKVNYVLKNIKIREVSFEGLINNIKSCLSDKGEFISYEASLQLVPSLWYGPGQALTALTHLENLATMLALYSTALLDPSYKRNRLATLLSSNKRRIDLKAIEALSKIVKEHTDV